MGRILGRKKEAPHSRKNSGYTRPVSGHISAREPEYARSRARIFSVASRNMAAFRLAGKGSTLSEARPSGEKIKV